MTFTARIMHRQTDFYLDDEWTISLDAAEILREYHSRPLVMGATGYAIPAFTLLE